MLSKKKMAVTPFCELCWNEGREELANVVDHIIELKDDQSLAYSWSNLMSMCHKHHNRKTKKVESDRKESVRIKKLGLFTI